MRVGKVGKGESVNIVMTRTGMGKFEFISGIHNELGREPFMVMDYNTVCLLPSQDLGDGGHADCI